MPYPKLFIDLFGSYDNIKNIPLLDYNENFSSGSNYQWSSSSHYIDDIPPEAFKKDGEICPGIRRGKDSAGRLFFTFCYEQKINKHLPKYDVITLFERVPGGNWFTTGHYKKGMERLFWEIRFWWYRPNRMSDDMYYKYYPLESRAGEGVINVLREIIENEMVLTMDILIPPGYETEEIYASYDDPL